jgi:cysteinyl-tRNA synthetase
MIRLHNSLTGRKEELRPLEPGHVRMYVCGDTVYDFCHVGHARSKIAFDVARRYFAYRGLRVTFVRNITDIDDKIIKRAAENGEPIEALTARFIAAMHEDYDKLGILRPDREPRATEFVPQIIAMVQTLIDKGFAYATADGDVMYSVAKFEDYGKLSGKRLEDLRAGARVEVDASKRDPLDFVLWKASKPGEPKWESPWGPGRPGWHIECSAMATALLGAHFDLHGGGVDLKFPHHENEIAQSRAATGDVFADGWMHNGFVNVDSEKMSKSLGNFFTIREVLPKLRDPEVLRYLFVSSHYRGPINYSVDQLEQADAALGGLYTALRDLPISRNIAPTEHTRRFEDAMDDDLNTSEAVAVLQGLAREINTARAGGDTARAGELGAELKRLASVLGVLERDPAEWFKAGKGEGAPADSQIEALIAERAAARKAKNWQESDRIRDELAKAGVVLEDKPDGRTLWRRV